MENVFLSCSDTFASKRKKKWLVSNSVFSEKIIEQRCDNKIIYLFIYYLFEKKKNKTEKRREGNDISCQFCSNMKKKKNETAGQIGN